MLLFLTLSSCELINPVEEKTEQQLQAELLEGTWATESMEVASTGSVIDVFPDFKITININDNLTGGNISVSGDLVPNTDAMLIGAANASEWSFVGSSLTKINVSDAEGNADNYVVSINYSGSSLVLSLDYEQPTGKLRGLIRTYTVELAQ